MLSLASSERLYLLERGVVYSLVVFVQILNRGSLCGKSYVDDLVKILLCKGGNVEQWLEPQNISYCLHLIHYLLTLSFTLCLTLIHIVDNIRICLVLFVCVPHLY